MIKKIELGEIISNGGTTLQSLYVTNQKGNKRLVKNVRLLNNEVYLLLPEGSAGLGALAVADAACKGIKNLPLARLNSNKNGFNLSINRKDYEYIN